MNNIEKVEATRQAWRKGDELRDKNKVIDESVTVIKGELYASHPINNLLEMYYVKQEDKYPVIVNVHGGGYFYGDVSIYQYYCAHLATKGYFVVSFNYSLAPDFKYPTPLIEINQVMEYIVKNATKYNLDLNNLYMVGDSAGAQLASQYALIATNEKYAKMINIIPPEITFNAIGLNCGLYNIKHAIINSIISRTFRNYFGFNTSKTLDVFRYIDSNYPPSYIMTFNGDFLKNNAKPFYNVLKKANVDAKMKIFGDSSNGHVQHVDYPNKAAIEANDAELAFFKQHRR